MFVFSQLLVQEIASGFIFMYAKTCVSASIVAREHAIINIESKWSPIGSIDSTLPSSSLSFSSSLSSSLIITTSSSANSISEFVSDSEDTGDSIGSSGWKSASDSVECVAPETVSSLSVCHVPGPLRVASPRCRCLWASTNAVCNQHCGCDLAPLALAHPGLCSVPQLWGIQSATLTCLVAVEMKGHHDTRGD